VSTIKHAHHGFDLDQPGKDSFMHRTAGATEVVISSAKRFAILHELREEPEWDLPDLLDKLSPVDLVLVEGYKREKFPKLEVHRAANGKPLLHPDDDWIVAVAADVALPQASVPIIALDDIEKIADVLLAEAMPRSSARARELPDGAIERRLLRVFRNADARRGSRQADGRAGAADFRDGDCAARARAGTRDRGRHCGADLGALFRQFRGGRLCRAPRRHRGER
jgi:molybdopterin-guanine dinucleotide biosynthesis protein B